MLDVQELPLSSIRLDGNTQTRAQITQSAVDEYAELTADGQQAPPVDVFYDGSDYWLASGFHRLAAHRKVGLGVIQANVRKGTVHEARVFAAAANANHGIRRTNEDVWRAFSLLMSEGWQAHSINAVARHLRVSHGLVEKMKERHAKEEARKDIFDPPEDTPEEPDEPEVAEEEEKPSEVVAVRNGKEYRMKTGNIGSHRQEPQGKKILRAASRTLGVLQDQLQTANHEVTGRDNVPCKSHVTEIQKWIDRYESQAD